MPITTTPPTARPCGPQRDPLRSPGSCSGDCVNDDTTIAGFTFRDQCPPSALDSLTYALGDGSAWLIAGSDISVEKSSGAANLPALNIVNDVRGTVEGQPQIIPTTATERKDFSWIARLAQSCSSGCTLDSDLFDTVPPEIVAARFKINSGDLYTYSIARLGSNVTPCISSVSTAPASRRRTRCRAGPGWASTRGHRRQRAVRRDEQQAAPALLTLSPTPTAG